MRILIWSYVEPTGEHGYGSVGIREGDWAGLLRIVRSVKRVYPSVMFWWGG